MNVLEYLKDNILFLDGGMGTVLQSQGLPSGHHPELWNISHPDVITSIHRRYTNAGANVICANTFGANSLKFDEKTLDNVICSAIANARAAADKENTYVALDIGPTGKLLKPYGELDFDDAVSVFAETVKLGVKYGADLIFIETMNDAYETKAALLAAKENSTLPVFVSNAYGEDGTLMTGTCPESMVAILEGMGADAIGVNCSLGPKQLMPIVDRYLKCASVPVLVKPNAGLPKMADGHTVYDVSPDEFAHDVRQMLEHGVSIAGGCCGTTPDYIKSLTDICTDVEKQPITDKNITCVTSSLKHVVFDGKPMLIGERINPTGKKRFKQALRENDIDYILSEGIEQEKKGVHILDVNVGLPDIDEVSMLTNAVSRLQSVTELPLQIDTSNIEAMENALRIYNGKAMINSVNGKKESMDAVFPLVKKYGGVVVALTLDEDGIPEDAEGRVRIAKKILSCASQYGIDKKDIIFDTLAMAVSADGNSALTTLESLYRIKTELGCRTSLGVSNISFGLPERDAVNSTFFALAMQKGLDAAIMNPYSSDMMRAYYSFNALYAHDANCLEYIEYASNNQRVTTDVLTTARDTASCDDELTDAIVTGRCEKAAASVEALLQTSDGLEIVQNKIIPALDKVGEGFEKKTVFLPQLLMSAEAAKASFEVIRKKISVSTQSSTKCKFVIATVKGDIHDIGKNIVKLLLENYGYDVIDLGRDVPPQAVLDAVQEHNAPIVGLSALMTTTVPAMEETIKLLHEKAPNCKTVVGGAVLTEEYAAKIGADKYAKDAMETVRYAESLQ